MNTLSLISLQQDSGFSFKKSNTSSQNIIIFKQDYILYQSRKNVSTYQDYYQHNFGQCCIHFQEYVQDGIIQYDVDVCYDQYFEEEQIECEREILSYELIYLISFSNSQEVITNCQIDQCIQCLYVQNMFKCLKCSQGYYADILYKQCISCPSQLNCSICQQQNKYYKDNWKWDIRAYYIYQFQTDLVSSLDQNDYEVICLTCLDGYMLLDNRCMLNCPKNCNRCSIINGQNICTFCGSNNSGKLLTIQNNECIICPSNCEFCQPRSSTDVQAINSLYNPEDKSQYYYPYLCLKPKIYSGIFYNQFLQQYVKCKDGQFSMGQIHIKLNAYCYAVSYDQKYDTYSNKQDFNYENVYTLYNSILSKIETPQFLEYLNGILIKKKQSLIYDLILISQTYDCQISNIITTKIQINVFTLLISTNQSQMQIIQQYLKGHKYQYFHRLKSINVNLIHHFNQGYIIRIN